MCTTCGCGKEDEAAKIILNGDIISDLSDEHPHHAEHHHHHDHSHHHDHGHHHNIIELERDILHENNLIAERNRGFFAAKNILALNLVSSPGSGKTTLLEKTISDLKNEMEIYVIEGDQQTTKDADRIMETGAPVVQVNTGKGCHLDSRMVNKAMAQLEPSQNSVVMIENVGNLVCPSMFDLGESFRVVIMSVTEGDDKPLKYPDMFASSQLCIINKIDLLPYVHFDVDKAREYASRVNHNLQFFELSATTGKGMEEWYDWLTRQVQTKTPV